MSQEELARIEKRIESYGDMYGPIQLARAGFVLLGAIFTMNQMTDEALVCFGGVGLSHVCTLIYAQYLKQQYLKAGGQL